MEYDEGELGGYCQGYGSYGLKPWKAADCWMLGFACKALCVVRIFVSCMLFVALRGT